MPGESERKRERMQTCGSPSSARTGDRKALLPATGMRNLPTYVSNYLWWCLGCEVATTISIMDSLKCIRNLGSARKRDGEWRGTDPFSVRSYGRCIIIALPPLPSPPLPLLPNHALRTTFPVAFYSQCTRIRACTIANKAIRCPAYKSYAYIHS